MDLKEMGTYTHKKETLKLLLQSDIEIMLAQARCEISSAKSQCALIGRLTNLVRQYCLNIGLPYNDISFTAVNDNGMIRVSPCYKGEKIITNTEMDIASAIERAITRDTHNLIEINNIKMTLDISDSVLASEESNDVKLDDIENIIVVKVNELACDYDDIENIKKEIAKVCDNKTLVLPSYANIEILHVKKDEKIVISNNMSPFNDELEDITKYVNEVCDGKIISIKKQGSPNFNI